MTAPDPLVPEERVEDVATTAPAEEVGSRYETLFVDHAAELSRPTRSVVASMADGGNAEKVFLTLLGHPQMCSGGTAAERLEARVVNFVRFYGGVVGSYRRAEVERAAVELIRASPVSDHRNDVWDDDDRAETRVAELFDWIDERDDRDVAGESVSLDEGEPTPQDLDGVSLSGPKTEYDRRAADTRRDLLGR